MTKKEAIQKLSKIGEEMIRLYNAEENRATEKPLFIVYDYEWVWFSDESCAEETELSNIYKDQEKDREYVECWIRREDSDGEYFDSKAEAREFEEEYLERRISDEEFDELYYTMWRKKQTKQVGWFFTEKAADQFMKNQAHNLHDPFTYARGLYYGTSPEMETIYDCLVALGGKNE